MSWGIMTKYFTYKKKPRKNLNQFREYGGLDYHQQYYQTLSFKNCKSRHEVALKITGYENSILSSGLGANLFQFQAFLCHQDQTANFFYNN